MALQHLRILLMVAARHAYDDVIGLADRLVDIRGDYVDAFPCFQCTDALNDLGICEIAESMDEVFRRKQPHFMSAGFLGRQRNGLRDVAGSKDSNFSRRDLLRMKKSWMGCRYGI